VKRVMEVPDQMQKEFHSSEFLGLSVAILRVS